MGVYSQLCAEAGGGVIDRSKLAVRNNGAALIIGLGGTGTNALLSIKKEVYTSLLPDDLDEYIPSYQSISFLAIDSDSTRIENQKGMLWDISETEFLDISNPKLGRFSMGGVRAAGRALLVEKAELIYQKIKSLMLEAVAHAEGDSLDIHICAGLSGSTGSGIFLDICYLVKAALKEIGKLEAVVHGYFFLPDVDLSIPAIAQDVIRSKVIQANGYSALKELDYCMNFGRNNDCFEMDYGFLKISDGTSPVDECYLLSAHNADGVLYRNPYRYAMGVVCEVVVLSLVEDESHERGLELLPHIAPLPKKETQNPVMHGGFANYIFPGAAESIMPFSEVLTYLGCSLFASFDKLRTDNPTKDDVESVFVGCMLTYEDIRAELTRGISIQIPMEHFGTVKDYKEDGHRRFVDFADRWLENNKRETEKRRQKMLEELRGFDSWGNGNSLIERLFDKLCQRYLRNVKYGPIYAARLICGGNNYNIIRHLDGMREKNRVNLEREYQQREKKARELDAARVRMDSAGIFNNKRRFEEYSVSMRLCYTNMQRIDLYENLDVILSRFREQIIELDKMFFDIFLHTYTDLSQTFAENAVELSTIEILGSDCSRKILSVLDVREELDSFVSSKDISYEFDELINVMIRERAACIERDENRIAGFVSKYLSDIFQGISQRTLTDYLAEKFGTINNNALASIIARDMIDNDLAFRAKPLFWRNPGYIDDAKTKRQIAVPYDSIPVVSAAYSTGWFDGKVCKKRFADRISVIEFVKCPLYAYQGLRDLENKYENTFHVCGRHLFESGDKDWNTMLPSPIPFSAAIEPSERITQRNKQLLEEFEEAERLGVVVSENGRWFVCTAEPVDDVEQNSRRVEIRYQKAKPDYERQVMLDAYLMSPVLNAMVHEAVKRAGDMHSFVCGS